MSKVVGHLKQNLVAYLALFVALGGTSYAALRIPPGSVGNRQLQNHSVTPVKLDGGKTAGYVADWAQITGGGLVAESRPRGARILGWNGTPDTPFIGGAINWSNKISGSCIAVASAVGFQNGPATPSSVSAELNGPAGQRFVNVHESAPTTVNVAVICPIP
jgi:hypothetical protein